MLTAGGLGQSQIGFSSLPLVSAPTPVPNGYFGLNWSNILYVDPAKWSGAGPGYMLGSVPNQDVAFVGSASCSCCVPQFASCFGSITVSSNGGTSNQISFQALSGRLAAGFGPTSITALAYKKGNFVGSAVYRLDTQVETVLFPPSWGGITQLTFQTDAGGDLVFYSLDVNISGGSPPPR
jgi:hypothetical protein